ncbi:eukaryotic translation initiation factor 2D [Microcaecilia unicolor]|uniref:Eukaryotic translation initiation factor 2D n=1 Tax=Microcaecilia unicolor TaxID=1415580 RepID=A0A6P7ZFJ6_9AMPH|nr:eukaryotic translation initiation factor 2D [Microcaecilia unicolor]
MFCKAFRVKSNTVVKGSDRRKLRADVVTAFPALGSEKLSELIPSKEELNLVKLYTHKGEAVTVYVQNRNPILFEVERRLYPTVYTLWSYPDLLPSFVTWPPVLQKLAGGADLMLPGVVLPPSGLPQIQQGNTCAITLVGNRAPVAVGIATMSTAEMLGAGMKGKGVTVLHTYTDQLWALGEKCLPPIIPSLELETTKAVDGNEEERPTTLSHEQSPATESLSLKEAENDLLQLEQGDAEVDAVQPPQEDVKDAEPTEQKGDMEEPRSSQELMDELLLQCFFQALKSRVKKSDLPLLTSTFLRNHMFSSCPEGKQVDIKKSSYKKLSRFLQCMQNRKILQVRELSKGVESIVDVDWKHPEIRAFVALDSACTVQDLEKSKEKTGDQPYHPPDIVPLYGISAKMLPLFQEAGQRKGDVLSSSDVKSIIISYVKSNELVDEDNKNFVTINPILCDCVLEKSEQSDVAKLKWEDLLSRCMERLQPFYQVTFHGQEPMLRKGSLDPIDITVAQRSSNKKVTLIKNLELYALDPHSVAAVLQQRVQASATVTALPGSKDRAQVQIQGNQVRALDKLLLEEYSLPRKYVQGLEKASKSSKKK